MQWVHPSPLDASHNKLHVFFSFLDCNVPEINISLVGFLWKAPGMLYIGTLRWPSQPVMNETGAYYKIYEDLSERTKSQGPREPEWPAGGEKDLNVEQGEY